MVMKRRWQALSCLVLMCMVGMLLAVVPARAAGRYTELVPGVGQLAEVDGENVKEVWFEYTATMNAEMKFYSTGDQDTYGSLYDEDMELLTENDDCYESTNFAINYNVLAGRTYYLKTRLYNVDNKGSYQVRVQRVAGAPHLSWNGDAKTLAVGVTDQLELVNSDMAKDVSWRSEDESICTVDENGKVKAIKSGEVVISVSGKDVDGYEFTDSVLYVVTNPKLAAKNITLNIYGRSKSEGFYYFYDDNQMLYINGINPSSYIDSVKTSSPNLELSGGYLENDTTAYFYLRAKKAGDYTVEIVIDGKKLTCKVVVTKLYFKYDKNQFIVNDGAKKWVEGYSTLTMYKGETTTLKVAGLKDGDKVKWSSSNKDVAKVSSKGKVTCNKNGTAIITATIGSAKLTYRVEVSYKVAIKALRYAYKHYDSIYSQDHRMEDGYYDCSSYVWRSYHAGGKDLLSKNWAPTAADLAKWCVKEKVMVYKGNVPVSKLKPGDLIFECGADNGRYEGIYHVDLFQGNYTAITVARTKYYGSGGKLYDVMIARPCGGKVKMKKCK